MWEVHLISCPNPPHNERLWCMKAYNLKFQEIIHYYDQQKKNLMIPNYEDFFSKVELNSISLYSAFSPSVSPSAFDFVPYFS